jgi:hypothetical protein
MATDIGDRLREILVSQVNEAIGSARRQGRTLARDAVRIAQGMARAIVEGDVGAVRGWHASARLLGERARLAAVREAADRVRRILDTAAEVALAALSRL